MFSQPSLKFAFLAYHDARLVALGVQAEEQFATDATVRGYKLRQFGDVFANCAPANVGPVLGIGKPRLPRMDRILTRKAVRARGARGCDGAR